MKKDDACEFLKIPPLNARDLDSICDLTSAYWSEVRGQRIFLTGGTGFFGCWLIESFLAANRRFSLNAQMTVLTRSSRTFQNRCPHITSNAAVRLLQGDVRSFRFPKGDFAYVIHAAADYSATLSSQPSEAMSVIVDGTEHTLDFASSHRTRNFLMISSGAVYQGQSAALSKVDKNQFGDTIRSSGRNAYAEAKRAAEAICASYKFHPALACKIVRCFTFVGPHIPLDGIYAVGNFISSVLRSECIRVNGDGSAVRSYLYASDLAVWLWAALFRAPSLDPIDIGSEDAINIRDLAGEVAAALNYVTPIEMPTPPQSSVPASIYVPSTQKAYDLLKVKQTVSLREAICRTAEWYGWASGKEQNFEAC